MRSLVAGAHCPIRVDRFGPLSGRGLQAIIADLRARALPTLGSSYRTQDAASAAEHLTSLVTIPVYQGGSMWSRRRIECERQLTQARLRMHMSESIEPSTSSGGIQAPRHNVRELGPHFT